MSRTRTTALSRLLAICAVLGLLAAACGGTDAETEADPAPEPGTEATDDPGETAEEPAAPEPDDGDEVTLVVAIEGDITTVDPQGGVGIIDRNVLQNSYDGIIRRDGETGEIIPHAITEWSLSDDELVWTLSLRDDITFHDGEHFTAEDLQASVERITHPDLNSQSANFWDGIEEIVILDDYTVEFHLDEPNPLLMIFGERLQLVSKRWADEVGNDPYTGEEPVGMGAYRIVDWRRDDQIVFEAFDDYFLGRPEIDRVIFRPIPDEAARLAALRAGEVDIVTPLSPQFADEVDNDPNLQVIAGLSMARVRLSMDQRESPWDILEVRQAVNYAVDVETIVNELVFGAVQIPGVLNPEEVGYAGLEPYPYDPDRARELLAEAGYPDGFGPFEFSVNPSYAQSEEAAQAVQSFLAEVGIQAELRVYDPGDFNTRKREKEENPGALGPLMFDGHSGGNTFHGYHFLFNVAACEGGSVVHSGYGCVEEAEALTREAVDIWASDEERAIELLQQAETAYYEQAWAGFLYQVPSLNAARADLTWEPSPAEPLQMRFASFD